MTDTISEVLTNVMDIDAVSLSMGKRAKAAAKILAASNCETRSKALASMASYVRAAKDDILAANREDVTSAIADKLSDAMIDRLKLDDKRLEAIAKGLEEMSAQGDNVGKVIEEWTRPNGLLMQKVRIPIGTIGIIYESRPNVTADAGGLCVRSGNSVILRGGSDAFKSSTAIANALRAGLKAVGLPEDAIQFIPTTDRTMVGEMLKGMGGNIDMIVPRGGKSLVARVQNEAKVPVLSHLDGINHTYIHKAADEKKAIEVTLNAKMRRTGICGATETLLIDEDVAGEYLPELSFALSQGGCELRGCPKARAIIPMGIASEEDWGTEYLAPILSVKIVKDINEAIEHIANYGSGHTDAIITEDLAAADKFLAEVDSAIVMHNTSTQYADGGEFGFGGEIGIGTGRLHARGPVGAEGLTTYKYVVRGSGQVRP
jgi:glutamate-5-semialdehyde dehydrogenase